MVIKFLPALALRGGKLKTPVSLERIQSPTNTIAIELGLINNLVPTRDIGYEISGKIINSFLAIPFIEPFYQG